ncbi:MAG: response regulator transcription factor [Eudoraea sp.]|nr:response regulator transcription factor [Eudoraea sp.]
MIRIVIVEDMSIIVEGIKLLLKKIKDFEIIGVYSNGKDFLASLPLSEPDIVLTDIQMPIMDGISMTKLATNLNPQLKIIALSMHTDRKYLIDMVNAGVSGYITNKSSAKELETGIRDVYNGKKYLSRNLLSSRVLNITELRSQIKKITKLFPELGSEELEILLMLSHGHSTEEITQKFEISKEDLERTKVVLFKKTNTKSNNGLLLWLIKNTFITN